MTRICAWIKVAVVIVSTALCLAVTVGWGQADGPGEFELTAAERAWLDDNPDKLTLYYNTEFPPIEFADADGGFVGMGADVIAIIEDRLGIEFIKQACPDWNRHLAALKSGECAVAPTIVKTPERLSFAYFTTPYATVPVVIITDRAAPKIELADLEDRSVAVVSGFATEEYLRSRLSRTDNLVTVENVPAGVRSVSFGQVEAFVENLAVAAYYIDSEGLPNLRVAGVTDYTFDWSIGISREYPELYSAVQKALSGISEDELEQVRQDWISLAVPTGLSAEALRRIKLATAFVGLLVLCLSVITFILKRQLNAKVASLRAAQADLLDQTGRLQMTMEVTRAGSWEFHIDTGALHVSEQWYTMLGFPPGPAVTTLEKAAETIHPEDFRQIDSKFKEYFSGDGKGAVEVDMRVLDADGNYRWIMCKGRIIARNDDGAPTRMIGLNLDIHNQRITRQELAIKENRLRAIFNAAPYPIVINSMADGRYLDANPAFLSRWGVSRDRLSELEPWELSLVPHADLPQLFEAVEREGMILNQQTEVETAGGEVDHFLASYVLMDIAGQRQILTILVDVTEAKRAEVTLRESEFKFRSFFDWNPEGVLLLEYDGRILDANQALLDLSGYGIEEIVGHNFMDFIPVDHHEKAVISLHNAQSGMKDGRPVELEYLRRDGSRKPIVTRGWRMSDISSSPVLLGVFIHDLSVERQLEQEKAVLQDQLLQSQKMEAIGTLAGGIAHDFNNMLFGILGYTDMALAAVEPDTEAAGLLREVIIAGQRASDLTRQILTFARRSEREVKPVDLVALVREVLRLVSSTLPKSISIQRELHLEKAVVNADDSELHQVLINLCTNAGHAMRKDGGTLTIELDRATAWGGQLQEFPGLQPGDYIQLKVRDTGSGIPPEIRERIFEPFFTTKERGEGTGMGLSVVHGIITELGGAITIDSAIGRGTEFTVYIPSSGDAQRKAAPAVAGAAAGTERILIVDDEESLAEMLGRQLRSLGYKTSVFTDSRDALEEVRQHPADYDVLLTDLAMPYLAGDELVSEARKVRADLPVVVCTGFMDAIIEERLDGMGIKYRLAKPLKKAELAEKLRQALDHQDLNPRS